MRILLLLRGSAGSGKSTWVEANGLKPYTLSTDDIRLMYHYSLYFLHIPSAILLLQGVLKRESSLKHCKSI
jgi:predicted kinase